MNDEARLLVNGYIGCDEAGKGDYFGPLVTAAVGADADGLRILTGWGVRDSKTLSPGRIESLADKIREMLPCSIVVIGPPKYNELYGRTGNLNHLLAWAHARTIENLLNKYPGFTVAIVDRFAAEAVLRTRMLERGGAINLLQKVGGESYPAVAAASIIARDEFCRRLDELAKKIGRPLPRGATHVVDAARDIYRRGGEDALGQVAKLHFKTTAQVKGALL